MIKPLEMKSSGGVKVHKTDLFSIAEMFNPATMRIKFNCHFTHEGKHRFIPFDDFSASELKEIGGVDGIYKKAKEVCEKEGLIA